MVGELAESGVRATCSGDFTIVYRHRSAEWPVPYTDSHTPGAQHEVIERARELAPETERKREKRKGRKRERGRRRKKEEGEQKRNTTDKDKREAILRTRSRQTKTPKSTSIPLDRFTTIYLTNERIACVSLANWLDCYSISPHV